MNVILDTSFLLGLFNPDDGHHEAARRQFSLIEGFWCSIPSIVCAELLVQQKEGVRLIEACKEIQKQFTPLTEKELRIIAKIPERRRKTLKANDCVILAHALNLQAKLLTFDQKLLKTYEELR